MYVDVCVCMCAHVCACTCVCMRMCVSVCVNVASTKAPCASTLMWKISTVQISFIIIMNGKISYRKKKGLGKGGGGVASHQDCL